MKANTTLLALTLALATAGSPCESRAESCSGIAPLGIPLAQPFDPKTVGRVVKRMPSPAGNIVRYEIKPSEPNPLFQAYWLTTTARGGITHEVTARLQDCSGRCEADFRKLAAGLEAKYGRGTEIVETGTDVQLETRTFLWTLFGRDCRIRLEVTPPGPLELSYTDFSAPVREALRLGPAERPTAPDSDIMRGL